MKKPTALILMVLAAVQLMAGVVTWSSWRSTKEQVLTPLLGGIKAKDVTSLEIIGVKRVDGKPPERTLLVKQGQKWVMPEFDGYPADSLKTNRLLMQLVNLKVGDPITSNPANHRSLEVDEGERRRRIIIKTKSEEKTLILGEGGLSRSVNVRFEGKDEVWRTNGITIWTAKAFAADYIKKKFFSFEYRQLHLFKITKGESVMTLVRQDDKWRITELSEDQKLDQSQLEALLGAIASMKIYKPVGKPKPEYGLGQDAAVVYMYTKGKALTKGGLTVGKATAGGQVYVKADDSPFVVLVPKRDMEMITDDQLLEKIKTDAAAKGTDVAEDAGRDGR